MARDYALTGENGQAPSPTWYRTKVEAQDIRRLMQKSDARAGRDALLWLGALVVTGAIAVLLFPSWWSLPFWLAYGVLYSSASDARWHEMGHSTAFETKWKNEAVYQIASFFLIRSPLVWRASHVRHHTDTIIVGRDPEIQAMRPPDLPQQALRIFGIPEIRTNLARLALHLQGRLHPEEETYVREADRARVFRTARIWAAVYAATLLIALLTWSIIPLLLVFTPRLYGSWHMTMTGMLQHLGLAENVTDHRLNTRTVMMNGLNRFLYLNMNYHVEHHMFTMVPYYNLPALHELIRHDLPEPDPSIWAAYRRLIPVLIRQLKYEDAVILPDLPPTATPYGSEADTLRPHAV